MANKDIKIRIDAALDAEPTLKALRNLRKFKKKLLLVVQNTNKFKPELTT